MRDVLLSVALLATWALLASPRPVLAVAPPAAAKAAADDQYQLGLGHYKQKRWALAVEHLGKFLKVSPRDPRVPSVRLLLGVSLTQLEKYSRARDELQRLVKDHPKDRNRTAALFRIGVCSFLLEEYKLAERQLQSYLKAAPKHALRNWGQLYLADSQRLQGRPDTAETVYRKSLVEFPKSQLVSELKFGLAACCQANNKLAEAREIYNELSQSKDLGHAANALSQLGSLEFEAGRFTEAADTWDQLVKRFPKSHLVDSTQLNTGYALFKLKRFPEAIGRFQAARRLSSQAALADYWRGICLKSLDRHADAISAFGQAEKAKPAERLARDVQFQWADTEFRAGNFDHARTRFLQVVDRWPQHAQADQGLLFATEAALLEVEAATDSTSRPKTLTRARSLVDRFEKDYPDSKLAWRHKLQAGRLEAANGNQTGFRKAIVLFQEVLAGNPSAQTHRRTRYQLGRTAGQLEDHELVLASLAPLLTAIRKADGPRDFDDAFVLDATSQLARKQYAHAVRDASDYLSRRPDGPLAGRALMLRAEAEEYRKQPDKADQDLARLAKQTTGPPLYPQTLQRLAERAYEGKHYVRSGELFARLVTLGKTSPFHAAGLSGLAWSLFEQRQYGPAAKSFSRVVSEHPGSELAGESAYKAAESLEKQGDTARAISGYLQAGRSQGTSRYAFLSTRRAARLLAGQQKTSEADLAFSELLKKFPAAERRDQLLFEWAGLHADAGNFKRADEIYRLLLREAPRSDLVDNARFSLAESDLVAGKSTEAAGAFALLAADEKADKTVQQDSLYRLIGIAAGAGQWQDVRQQSESLLKRFPQSRHHWESRFQFGQACLHLKQHALAKKTLVNVLRQRDTKNVGTARWFDETWVLLAETHFQLKEYDDVVRVVEDLRRTRPATTVLYKADEILGRSLLKKPRPDFVGGRLALRRAIDSKTGRRTRTAARSHLQLADSFLLQKNYTQAKKEFLAVHILYKFPTIQAPALYQAGACHEQLKEWSEAVKVFELLLKQFGSDPYADRARKRLPRLRRLAAP